MNYFPHTPVGHAYAMINARAAAKRTGVKHRVFTYGLDGSLYWRVIPVGLTLAERVNADAELIRQHRRTWEQPTVPLGLTPQGESAEAFNARKQSEFLAFVSEG